MPTTDWTDDSRVTTDWLNTGVITDTGDILTQNSESIITQSGDNLIYIERQRDINTTDWSSDSPVATDWSNDTQISTDWSDRLNFYLLTQSSESITSESSEKITVGSTVAGINTTDWTDAT